MSTTYRLSGAQVDVYVVQEVETTDGWQQVHDQMVVHHVLGIELQSLQVVLGEVSVQLLFGHCYNIKWGGTEN